MCYSYNTKRAFRAIGHNFLKPLLEAKAPELTVDWGCVTQKKVEPLYAAFLKLDDETRAIIDSCLYEICSFADQTTNAATLHTLLQQHGIAQPEGFDDWSVHDKATWVYLQDEAVWTQAARFAHIDRMPDSLWFTQKLFNGGAGRLEYADERFDRLETEISAYIYSQEGRGKYCYHEYFERPAQGQECFFIYLSDYPRSNMQWKGGKDFTRGIDKTAYEIVVVYDWKENLLSLRTTGERAHKIRLCKIWADVMRDTIITDADAKKEAFNLSVFKNGPADLPVDPLSDVQEAKILMLETSMDGKIGSRRVFQESERDLYAQMQEELNPEAFPMSLMKITCVKIRLGLDPKKYGRSKVQTVTVRPDHCDINSKNPSVQETIMTAMKGWRVCA